MLWPNSGLLFVQNSETGIKVPKITKNHISDISQVFMDTFGIKAPINNGTQHLIIRIRHKPNIGWNNMEKIDLHGGKNASNEIAGFFYQLYLQNAVMNIFDFLHGAWPTLTRPDMLPLEIWKSGLTRSSVFDVARTTSYG